VCECHLCRSPAFDLGDDADRIRELEFQLLTSAPAGGRREWDEIRTDLIIATARRTLRRRQFCTTAMTIVLVVLAALLGLRLTLGA
jgi:hypothetical protein